MKLKLQPVDVSYIGKPIWDYDTYDLAYNVLSIMLIEKRISKQEYDQIVQELNHRLYSGVFKLAFIPDMPNYKYGQTETLAFSYYTYRNRLKNYEYIPVIHHRYKYYLQEHNMYPEGFLSLPIPFVVKHRIVVGFIDRIGITTCRIFQLDMSDNSECSEKEYDDYVQYCSDYIFDQRDRGNSVIIAKIVTTENAIEYYDSVSDTRVLDRNPEGPESAKSVLHAFFNQNEYHFN